MSCQWPRDNVSTIRTSQFLSTTTPCVRVAVSLYAHWCLYSHSFTLMSSHSHWHSRPLTLMSSHLWPLILTHSRSYSHSWVLIHTPTHHVQVSVSECAELCLACSAKTAAILSSKTVCIVKLLLWFITLQHCPLRGIMSDRGHQIVGDAVEELVCLCDSQFHHWTPYHRRTNGLVERTKKILIWWPCMYLLTTKTGITLPLHHLRLQYCKTWHRIQSSLPHLYTSTTKLHRHSTTIWL